MTIVGPELRREVAIERDRDSEELVSWTYDVDDDLGIARSTSPAHKGEDDSEG